MKHDRKQLADFASRYLQSASRNTHARARKQAGHITTLIIDTASLSSNKLLFDRSIRYGESGKNPLEVARRALVAQSGKLADALAPVSQSKPLSILSGRVRGTVWHHGASFYAAWVGNPASVAHYADLTDTERERFLLQCRKLAAHGSMVYAVAHSEHKTEPAAYSDSHAEVVGLIVLHPQIHHGTEEAVARIREAGITLVYASKDTEHVVQTFAAVSLLAPNHTAPYVHRPGRKLPANAELYASLTSKARQKIIDGYPAETTLVVDEPLPLFWRQFSAFLS